MPSHIGWKEGQVKDSMQWVSASAPVAAVSFGGNPTVSSGSSNDQLGEKFRVKEHRFALGRLQRYDRAAAYFAARPGR
jgi:hypothetical protein